MTAAPIVRLYQRTSLNLATGKDHAYRCNILKGSTE